MMMISIWRVQLNSASLAASFTEPRFLFIWLNDVLNLKMSNLKKSLISFSVQMLKFSTDPIFKSVADNQ